MMKPAGFDCRRLTPRWQSSLQSAIFIAMPRICKISLTALAAGLFAFVPPATAGPQDAYLAAYGRLLSDHVRLGQKDGIKAALVDYPRWGKDERHAEAMTALRRVDPEKLSGRQKMAFWINAYNLLTIDLIIKTGETKSIRNQGGLFRNVWKIHRWRIAGAPYTLDQIEHEILRPLGDPRIHFAINCASLSCPDLSKAPYRAETLERQLETQTRLFLRNPAKGLKKTASGIRLSKIFDWFEEDFGRGKNLMRFLRAHLPGLREKPTLKGYLDYDWSLNCRPCRRGLPEAAVKRKGWVHAAGPPGQIVNRPVLRGRRMPL